MESNEQNSSYTEMAESERRSPRSGEGDRKDQKAKSWGVSSLYHLIPTKPSSDLLKPRKR